MKKEISFDSFRDEYPFEAHYLKIGSMRMHYVDEGKGPVILLLHATPMWSFAFRRFIKDLSKTYRVIAPDLMGFGLSDKPDDYDYRLDSHIDNLERLVDSLRITKMSILMQGWGATIGCGYIIRNSYMVDKVILLNAMAFSGYSLPFRLKLLRMFPWIAKCLFLDSNLMFSGLRRLPPKVRNGYLYPYQTHKDWIAILRFISELPCYPTDKSFETLIEIEHGLWIMREHPICIIWAGGDWLYPARHMRKWLEIWPRAKLVCIEKAGRFVTEEAYDRVYPKIESFLESEEEDEY